MAKKATLSKGGSEEAYVEVKQAIVALEWTSDVDFALLALFKAKDGRTGGVWTKEITGSPANAQGDLNSFPFINLDQDAGVGATGGDNIETMRIAKLDDMQEVHFLCLNFTNAAGGAADTFSQYNGRVTLKQDNGEGFEVPLESTEAGHLVHVCTLELRIIGPKLKRVDKVISYGSADWAALPGAAGFPGSTGY